MKKIFAMLLALIMVISMLPLAAYAAEDVCSGWGSNGVHNWRNGQCQNWNCGAKCEHEEYSDGVCTRCGMTCSHQKSNGYWGSTSAFVNGVCSLCDYECPHSNYGWDNRCSVCQMNKPTCTNHTYENGVCTKCGEVCKHPKSKIIPSVEPTCSIDGKTAGSQCETCEKILTAQQTRPATNDHKYTEFVGYKDGSVPTCTTPGVEIYKCATCDRTDEKNVTAAHKEKILREFEATCADKGYIFYTCEQCGFDWHEEFEKLPHTEKILPVVPATCTESGLKAGKQCSVCEEVLLEQEVVAALGHDWKTVAAKAATCTVNGNNQHQECNRCHATLNKEIIPAAHDFSKNPNKCSVCQARNPGCQHTNASITTTKEATCKASGTQTFACPDCGDTFVEILPQLNYHNYVNGVCSWCKAESCSHSYSTERVEPTCTENGYERTYCVSCGKITNSQTLTKRGHDFNNSVIDGFCSRCGCVSPNANKTNDLQDIFLVG